MEVFQENLDGFFNSTKESFSEKNNSLNILVDFEKPKFEKATKVQFNIKSTDFEKENDAIIIKEEENVRRRKNRNNSKT